jgi:diguanylate cyclase (GGDEF)-like protein
MDTQIGLLIQLNGVFLITILSLFLRRSLKIAALKYWTIAWLCLSFSLICVRLAFSYESVSTLLFTYHYLGEYIFGFMLVAGCLSLDSDKRMPKKIEAMIVPFIITAISLPLLTKDFYSAAPYHSLVMSIIFAAGLYAILRSEAKNFGWHVLRATIFLFFISSFTHFVMGMGLYTISYADFFLSFRAVIDLVLQSSLGFGMVIVLLDRVLMEVKSTNEKLEQAQRELDRMVHTDPLTAAFNRHAFYGFVHRGGENAGDVTGCVGFFDIDGLKSINEVYGHAAGDSAIRHLARAIRSIIRAEDLLYRWGGDEFFVIMVSMNSELAETRMSRLEHKLRDLKLDGVGEPVTIGVSWGFRDFTDADDLENAIRDADSQKNVRKNKRNVIRGYSVPNIPSASRPVSEVTF